MKFTLAHDPSCQSPHAPLFLPDPPCSSAAGGRYNSVQDYKPVLSSSRNIFTYTTVHIACLNELPSPTTHMLRRGCPSTMVYASPIMGTSEGTFPSPMKSFPPVMAGPYVHRSWRLTEMRRKRAGVPPPRPKNCQTDAQTRHRHEKTKKFGFVDGEREARQAKKPLIRGEDGRWKMDGKMWQWRGKPDEILTQRSRASTCCAMPAGTLLSMKPPPSRGDPAGWSVLIGWFLLALTACSGHCFHSQSTLAWRGEAVTYALATEGREASGNEGRRRGVLRGGTYLVRRSLHKRNRRHPARER